jgi:hypothetical protein
MCAVLRAFYKSLIAIFTLSARAANPALLNQMMTVTALSGLVAFAPTDHDGHHSGDPPRPAAGARGLASVPCCPLGRAIARQAVRPLTTFYFHFDGLVAGRAGRRPAGGAFE